MGVVYANGPASNVTQPFNRNGAVGRMTMSYCRAKSLLKMATVSLVIAMGLAACGVRGSLELPPEAKAEQEKAKAAKADPNYKAEHKGFILDGLLR